MDQTMCAVHCSMTRMRLILIVIPQGWQERSSSAGSHWGASRGFLRASNERNRCSDRNTPLAQHFRLINQMLTRYLGVRGQSCR